MSDNDYIAEYIKEKYPTLLGFDFAMWKLSRQFAKAVTDIAEGITGIFKDLMDECTKEGQDETNS